jgi:broad specificity phosphatase PhoE
MRKLILIKHASPLVIPGTPPEKWKLSEKGKESCGPLAEALREHQPTVIVASEEPKATETAQIVAAKLGLPFEATPELHEHDRSNVPHMRSGEFISHMEVFFRKREERVLGRESARQALDRFTAAIDGVLAAHPSGNVAVVSHGTVIALLLAQHSKENAFELWRMMGLPSFAVLSLPDYRLETMVRKIPT